MTKDTIVVDLDGTLCNSAHREHLARAGQWDEFHALLKDDEPWPDVKKMIEVISVAGFTVIGLTGRNERWRKETDAWLMKHKVGIDELLMRPDDCYESDTVIKPRLLTELFEDAGFGAALENVLLILEDRDKMVEEWRNLGFSCWQCRAGGY